MSVARNLIAVGAAAAVSMAVAGIALAWWLAHAPAAALQLRVPGADGRPAGVQTAAGEVDLAVSFVKFDAAPADLPSESPRLRGDSPEWPRFRGPGFDNISKQSKPLADKWPQDGPRRLWRVDLGEGHAAPVVWAGRVYVLDYDEKAKADAIRCFSLADGSELWRRSYSVSVKRNHGMSRTVPAVAEGALVTFGPRCHVVCLDPITGDFKWGVDLQRQYGAREPLWYAGQCPLIDGGRVILAPCGTDVLMMALDAQTGQEVWRTPNTAKWNMSHSSIMPMTIAGRRMYVYCAIGGMAGVSAEPGSEGTLLWQAPWSARVVAPSPVQLDGGTIFQAAGYGKGGMTVQVVEKGGAFEATIVEEHDPKNGIACEQQTAIYHDGLLYAIMPKDAGPLHGQFVCYNQYGALVWASGAENRFGLGPFLLADNKFYVLNDNGTLSMLRASRESFELLAAARVLDGQDAWGPIALAGNRMLLRDSRQMVCIDVGANQERPL